MKCPPSTTIQVESVASSFRLQFICGTARGKNEDLFSPASLKYWCFLQYNTKLTPLSGQSIKKTQIQGHGKKSENAPSQIYFQLSQMKSIN